MSCPDDNLLQAFVERSLGEPERAELIEHLDGCSACREILAGYARTLALSSGEGGEEATSRFGLGKLPREVGNFVATELLGAGAMGTVYLGRHRLLGHEVAIKVMRPDRALDAESEAVQRFIREARALTRIQDTSHIVRLYDFGQVELDEDDTLYYYAMEYAPGRDLERELRQRGRLEPQLAWSMLRQICAGLEAAHGSRILHRDLKPANVLVLDGEPLRLKILDFGLAKQLETQKQQTIGGMGSPLYAAPELIQGQHDRVGPWTDVYSLGVIAYRMLSGRMPFDVPEHGNLYQLIRIPIEERPIPLGEAAPGVTEELSRAVMGCISREPEKRPQTVDDAREVLERAFGLAEEPLEDTVGPARPSRRFALVAGLFALAGLVAGGLFWLDRRDRASAGTERPASVTRRDARPSRLVELLKSAPAAITVSSHLAVAGSLPEHLVDGDLDTGWLAGAGDLRPWIEVRLPPGSRVDHVRLTAGSGGDLAPRVSRVRLTLDGEVIDTASLDTKKHGLQRVAVDRAGERLRLSVVQTEPGSRWWWIEAGISELEVWGTTSGSKGGGKPTFKVAGFPAASSPVDAGVERPDAGESPEVAKVIARLQDEALDPHAAAALARKAAVPLDRRGRHAIAREINTRGFRLSLREQNKQALPLFLAAATISDRYGIPRYNAARIYAQAGDLERCLLYLSELAALGPYQRPRLLRTQKDPAFEPVWDEARYQTLFK
jgi:serine/threonine protein kinase